MSTNSAGTQLRFRHFDLTSDISRLANLLAEVEAVDHSGEDISEEALKAQLEWPGHDPVQDRWVVESTGEPDKVIAFCVLWKTPTNRHADITAAVHPAWRQRGIGSELLYYTLKRANELGASEVLAYADVKHEAANTFLRESRFVPVALNTAMYLSIEVPVEVPTWPAGYQVRRYSDVQDFPALLRAFNHCFEGLWGHHHLSEQELRDWLPSIDLDGTFLLYAPNEDVVGICRAEMTEWLSERYGKRMGYVDAPGIAPAYRAHRLHLPLLLAALQWLRSKEPAAVELESWGDDEQTLALYQSVGFTISRQSAIYRLELH